MDEPKGARHKGWRLTKDEVDLHPVLDLLDGGRGVGMCEEIEVNRAVQALANRGAFDGLGVNHAANMLGSDGGGFGTGRRSRPLTGRSEAGADDANCLEHRLAEGRFAGVVCENGSAGFEEKCQGLLSDIGVEIVRQIGGAGFRDAAGIALDLAAETRLIVGLVGEGGLDQVIKANRRDAVLHGVLLWLQ
ncbi:MAG: hypothetical protein EOQ41_24535 [Mesorhizobium sp.]|nr:MAG: hypothetical protein EOQ41_24535 [Mesorhizobium sp.]